MKRFSFFASLGFGSFFFRILTRGFDDEDPWYPAHLASARYTNHEAFGSCVVKNLKKVSFIHRNFTRPLCFVVGDWNESFFPLLQRKKIIDYLFI